MKKEKKLTMNTLFQEKPQVIKSIQNSDRDILVSIRKLFLNDENFDLDPCYSTGKFYNEKVGLKK